MAKPLFLPLPSLSPHAALPLLLKTANFDGPGASSLERERPCGVAGITVKNQLPTAPLIMPQSASDNSRLICHIVRFTVRSICAHVHYYGMRDRLTATINSPQTHKNKMT